MITGPLGPEGDLRVGPPPPSPTVLSVSSWAVWGTFQEGLGVPQRLGGRHAGA